VPPYSLPVVGWSFLVFKFELFFLLPFCHDDAPFGAFCVSSSFPAARPFAARAVFFSSPLLFFSSFFLSRALSGFVYRAFPEMEK
jgi:hypothetical protein